MQVHSAYTAYSLPIETRYNNDIKTEINNKSPRSNQDTVSISLEAREIAAQDASLSLNNEAEPLAKYRTHNENKEMSFMDKVKQALMDQRIGIDREKIEEIEEKMKAIIDDKSIPAEQKSEMLYKLEEMKKAELEKAAKRITEQINK